MISMLIMLSCAQEVKKDFQGTWAGNPRNAEVLSEHLDIGSGSWMRVKLFEREGVLGGSMYLEGELSYTRFYSLDEDEDTWDEVDGVVLRDNTVSADYSISGFDFYLWGCFEGEEDEELVLHADQLNRNGRELFFRGVTLDRKDLEEDSSEDTGAQDTGGGN